MSDLFQIIYDYCDDGKETILITRDILNSISQNPKQFAKELEYELEEFSLENDMCEHCAGDLEYICSKERSECRGQNVHEITLDYKICKDCGKHNKNTKERIF